MALTQISTQGIKDGTITGSDLATSFATTGDFNFTGDNANILFDKDNDNIRVFDNASIDFGQSGDLKIHHTGNVNIIDDVQSKNISIQRAGSEQWKFGDGTFQGPDNKKIQLGNSQDLQIYHDASDSIISNTTGVFYIQNTGDLRLRTANTEAAVHCVANGAVELYYDNNVKLATINGGISVTGGVNTTGASSFSGDIFFGDNKKTIFGAGSDLQIYHDGTDSIISNSTGDLQITDTSDDITITAADDIRLRPQGGENGINVLGNGAVELYFNNVKKLYTYSDGAKVEGDFVFKQADGTTKASWSGTENRIKVNDSTKFIAGDGNDLQIYHDGSNSVILDNGTGNLKIYSNGAGVDIQKSNGENIARFITDGAVELYHDNSKKLETATGGVTVTGRLVSDGLNLGDGENLKLGTDDDCLIEHTGTVLEIDNNTGGINMDSIDTIQLRVTSGNETAANFIPNGAVELYHDNSKKFETTSDGVNIVDNVLKFQGQSNRHIKYRPGENDILYEFDSGDFYRQNIGSSRHEFFAGNVYKLGINTSGLLFPNTGTLSQNAMYFESGASTNEYSTMFGVTNYPDASGFSDQNDGFWAKIKSKGGCVVIINSDGGRNDGRNGYDHFSVYHREGESTNGKRAFSVDHVGGIQCGQAGINIDREWGNQPSFSMTRDCNDGTNNTDDNAYFRFHGTSRTHSSWTGGSNGADFSANMLLDGGNYNASDRRAKTDIVDCPYGLAEVLKLRPRKYQLVNSQLEPQGDDNINLGFIAQELMEILPEPVNYLKNEDVPNEKGFCRAYILDMNEVVPVLTKAIQELAAKVAVLETEVAALKTA